MAPGCKTPQVLHEFQGLQGDGRIQEKSGPSFPRTSSQPNACSWMQECWQEGGTVCIHMKWGFQGFKVSKDRQEMSHLAMENIMGRTKNSRKDGEIRKCAPTGKFIVINVEVDKLLLLLLLLFILHWSPVGCASTSSGA